MSDKRTFPWRLALLVFALHALVAAVTSWMKAFLWDTSSLAHQASRLVRDLDFAVLWPIDQILRSVTGVPAFWPFEIRWTMVIFETVLHSVFGGVFWALVAAGIAVVVKRRHDKAPAEA